ncbi:hypothetical protein ACWDPV_09555 [Gordonia sp. NPDC003504]
MTWGARQIIQFGGVSNEPVHGASPARVVELRSALLGDRVIRRIGTADDEHLVNGVEVAGDRVVGYQARGIAGYPEWALAHHPDDRDDILAGANLLHSASPFEWRKWERGAPPAVVALATEERARVQDPAWAGHGDGGQMSYFTDARVGERSAGVEPDLPRLVAAYQEFALRGQLDSADLLPLRRSLTAMPAPADTDSFCVDTFCAVLTAMVGSGYAPHVGMLADIAEVAEQCGIDPDDHLDRFLFGILDLPGTCDASSPFWTRVADRVTAGVDGNELWAEALLRVRPRRIGPSDWADYLIAVGADAALLDGRVDAGEWLAAQTYRLLDRGFDDDTGGGLVRLVEKVIAARDSGRIEVHRTVVGTPSTCAISAGLYDALLAAGLELEGRVTGLTEPATHFGRDLRFYAATHSFTANIDGTGRALMRAVTREPELLTAAGVAELCRRYTNELANRLTTTGSVRQIVETLGKVAQIPAPLMSRALASAVAALAPVSLLSQAIRCGLPSEYGWTMFEDLVEPTPAPTRPGTFASSRFDDREAIPAWADAWPAVGVRSGSRFVFVDGDDVVAECAGLPWNSRFLTRVDGEVVQTDGDVATWSPSGRRAHVTYDSQSFDGNRHAASTGASWVMPNGRRVWSTTSVVAPDMPALVVLREPFPVLVDEEGNAWVVPESSDVNRHQFRPFSGSEHLTPPDVIGLFPSALPGERLRPEYCTARPVTPTTRHSPVNTHNERHYLAVFCDSTEQRWRVVEGDGTSITVDLPRHITPTSVMRVPESGSHRWVLTGSRIYDADGGDLIWDTRKLVDGELSYRAAQPAHEWLCHLRPMWWHQLTVRDSVTSDRMRGFTDEDAQQLLAAGDDHLGPTIERVLPGAPVPIVADLTELVHQARAIAERRSDVLER